MPLYVMYSCIIGTRAAFAYVVLDPQWRVAYFGMIVSTLSHLLMAGFSVQGDDSGHVKYWQSNMNSIVDFTAHPNTIIRELWFVQID